MIKRTFSAMKDMTTTGASPEKKKSKKESTFQRAVSRKMEMDQVFNDNEKQDNNKGKNVEK